MLRRKNKTDPKKAHVYCIGIIFNKKRATPIKTTTTALAAKVDLTQIKTGIAMEEYIYTYAFPPILNHAHDPGIINGSN